MPMFSRTPFGVDPFSGGSLSSSYECCCDVACCGCSVNSPRRHWRFTASGITNNVCSSCSEFNGTFDLKWYNEGPPCLWLAWKSGPPTCADQAFPPDDLCENNYYWRLQYDNAGSLGDGFYLIPNTSFPFPSAPVYFLAVSSWNCGGSNVMTRDGPTGSGTSCATWPATLTLSPSSEIIPECECYPPYDAIASEWEVVVSGVTNGGCSDCSVINSTHILRPAGGTENFCSWNNTSLTICSGGGVVIGMGFRNWGIIELFFNYSPAGSTRTYGIALADFNPVGSNTLVLIAYTACVGGLALTECATWPATVTLRPRT